MKKLILIYLVLFLCLSTTSFASASVTPAEVLVELGDNYIASNINDKIWIENPKIFSATIKGTNVVIKPLQTGKSVIKLDKKNLILYAVPTGYKFAFEFWKKQVQKIAYLNVQFCENSICLTGKINSMNEFKNIIDLINENKAFIFLKLDMSFTLQNEIEKWYNIYFRNHEITPPKIIFESSPWKISLSSKDESVKNKDYSQKVGLFTEENKNKIEISDNVKVSVQFIEMKKSLMRSLGIAWPTSVNGKIRETSFEKIDDLMATLNASEDSGDSKTIANPNLVCRSGKEAEFWAGGEFPIRTTTNSRNHEVVWKKYGIQLKIKPLIDPLGQMSIEVLTEVSMPSRALSVDGIPAVTTNKVSSHFDLVKKRTIVLSGLIESNISNGKNGLPFLSQIPYLGSLFSSQSYLDHQTELVVLVTPELYE